MTAGKRARSETGFYHVMLRGNAKQLIFENDDDRIKFLGYLGKFSENDIDIVAWCLMGNHVHLVVNDPTDALSTEMHRLATSYAHYFNTRHDRAGHVFQGRFTSVPITDDEYLMQAVRYVHMNPVAAGIGTLGGYRWSSYPAYLSPDEDGLTSTAFVLDLFDGVEGFKAFHAERYPTCDLRLDDPEDITPDDVIAIANATVASYGCEAVADVKALAQDTRNRALRALRHQGLTVKQIARLTGVSEPTIYRAIKRS